MTHEAEKCRDMLALLSEYLDRELPPEAYREMQKHLAACSPCEEFVESFRKTIDLCRNYEPGAAPPPLSPEARGELEEAWRKWGGANA